MQDRDDERTTMRTGVYYYTHAVIDETARAHGVLF